MSQAITHASVFVLRRNPFRDNSLLLDLFSEEEGRLSAVVRYSKRQQARIKGTFEPFRLLACGWQGRGEVVTIKQGEEIQRYALKQAALIQATYLNELLLKALLVRQPHPKLFQYYQQTLQRLAQQASGATVLSFEMALLGIFGLELPVLAREQYALGIESKAVYALHPEHGLQRSDSSDVGRASGVKIPAGLLLRLRNPETLQISDQQVLRRVIDQLWLRLLPGKTLYARRLMSDDLAS